MRRSDEPYRSSDLLKPGFDPFEAHRAWLADRPVLGPTEYLILQERALGRIKAAIAREAAKPKRRKKRKVSEAADSVKLWKAALFDVKKKKRDKPRGTGI